LRRGRHALTACGLGLLACLVAGCGLIAFDEAPTAVNACSDDGGCASGAACDRALGMCVAASRPATGVFLRFTLPESTAVGIREYRSRRLDAPAGDPVGFPAPVDVQGWVRGDSRRTVAARLTVYGPSGIPGGKPEAVEVAAVDEPAEFEDWARGRTFAAALLPGTYAVLVEPTGDDAALFPPVSLPEVAVASPGEGRPFRLEVDLPPAETLRRVTGLVTQSDGVPLPNLTIYAEDPATGHRASTIDTTAPLSPLAGGDDPDPSPSTGSFEILLPAETASLRLVVAPTADAPTFPKVVFDHLDFVGLDTNGDTVLACDGTEQPALAFPALGLPVTLEARVEGADADGATPHPVPNAALRFFRTIDTGAPGVTASFEQAAVTDTEGAFAIPLLEGDYEVTVTPPASARLAGLHQPFFRVAAPPEGERVQRGQLFSLVPSAAIFGAVVDPFGRSAGALPVEAHLLEPAVGGTGAGANPAYLNRDVAGYTDLAGSFTLSVEPGTHFVLLRPADASRYPWRILAGIEAPDGSTGLALEAPVVLSDVVTIGGAPAAGVLVEALVRVGPDADSPVVVGRTDTDSAGAFRLLLSPSLGE
jgi:hypothetical protein